MPWDIFIRVPSIHHIRLPHQPFASPYTELGFKFTSVPRSLSTTLSSALTEDGCVLCWISQITVSTIPYLKPAFLHPRIREFCVWSILDLFSKGDFLFAVAYQNCFFIWWQWQKRNLFVLLFFVCLFVCFSLLGVLGEFKESLHFVISFWYCLHLIVPWSFYWGCWNS